MFMNQEIPNPNPDIVIDNLRLCYLQTKLLYNCLCLDNDYICECSMGMVHILKNIKRSRALLNTGCVVIILSQLDIDSY